MRKFIKKKISTGTACIIIDIETKSVLINYEIILSEQEISGKNIETEAIFTKTEKSNEKTLIFFKIRGELKKYED